MKELKIYPKKNKVIVSIVTLLVLDIISIYLAITEENNIFNKLMFVAVIIIFSTFICIGVKTLLSNKPTITIDDKGISTLHSGFIPWNKINDLYLNNVKGNISLGIDVKDSVEFVDNLPFMKKIMAKINLASGLGPTEVVLMNMNTDLNADDILKVAKEFLNKEKINYK